jgi:SOS-response transcriptional repressor LexA
MSLWATEAIKKLLEGKTIVIYPTGKSMTPIIQSKQKCVIVPVNNKEIIKGDIVLCKVKGNHYLHKVLAVKQNRYLIGNNHGGQNGWTNKKNLYGLYAANADNIN